MIIGLFSDIHGNPLALRKCLRAMQKLGVEQIYFLGDLAGYMLQVTDCFQLLQNHQVTCLKGNHDAMLLQELHTSGQKQIVYQHDNVRSQLNDSVLDQIQSWQSSLHLTLGNQACWLMHGAPWDTLQGYCYPNSDLTGFESLPFDAFFMGHTHYPFVHITPRGQLVCNVGSAGLPRDQGGLAAFAVYDSKLHKCDIYRIAFSVKEIMTDYETRLHKAVVDCLHRESGKEIVGTILVEDYGK